MNLDELLKIYPYPEKAENIKALIADNTELLQAGYDRIIEQAKVKKSKYIVYFNVWAFMACDKASDESEAKGTDFIDELKIAIKTSGTN